MLIDPTILARAEQYANRRQIVLTGVLGAGKDGSVWLTSRRSALKIHVISESYIIERNAYFRLRDLNVEEIADFSVPALVDHDDELLAIEMTVVTPPFLLDFASAIFDEPPDFIEDEGHTFEDFIRARFDEHTQQVLDLYHELAASTGIYLPDMHLQNVKFADPLRPQA
jgi:hypothetical protein